MKVEIIVETPSATLSFFLRVKSLLWFVKDYFYKTINVNIILNKTVNFYCYLSIKIIGMIFLFMSIFKNIFSCLYCSSDTCPTYCSWFWRYLVSGSFQYFSSFSMFHIVFQDPDKWSNQGYYREPTLKLLMECQSLHFWWNSGGHLIYHLGWGRRWVREWGATRRWALRRACDVMSTGCYTICW